MNIRILISKGSTSIEATNLGGRNLVRRESLQIEQPEYGKNFCHIVSTARFEVFFEGSLATLLSDDDVEVQILDGTTPLFTGYVRPVSSFEFSGKGAGDAVKVECLGASDRLRGTYSGAMIDYGDDIVVCSPDDTAHSFVHQIVSLMGWTHGVTAPSIPVALPIARLAPNTDLQRKLEKVLFDCGFYYADRPDGSIEILPFAVEDPESQYEFSVANGNIIRSVSIKRADDAERAVIVGYRKLNKVTDYDIYSESIGHIVGYSGSWDIGGRSWVWPFEQDEEGEPPYIKVPTSKPWDTRYAEWRKAFNIDGSLSTREDCLVPFPSPDVDGLDSAFWRYTDLSGEIVFLYGLFPRLQKRWTAHIDSDGLVSWDVTGDEGTLVQGLISILAEWTASGLQLKVTTNPLEGSPGIALFIDSLSIKGSIEYLHNNMEADEDEAAPRWYEGPRVESEKCKSLVADHLQQPADVERLAKALYGALRGATVSWKSLVERPAGTVVRVHHPARGVDMIARIKRRVLSVGTTVATWAYEAEGVEPFSITSSYFPYMIPVRSSTRPSSSAGLAAALDALASLNNKATYDDLNAMAASYLQLHSSSQILTLSGSGAYDPAAQRIRFWVTRVNTADEVAFSAIDDNGDPVVLRPDQDDPENGDRCELRSSDIGVTSKVTVLVSTVSGASDQVTIIKVQAKYLTGYLTNEAATVPTDADGSNGDYSNAGGRFVVLDGLSPATGVIFSIGDKTPGLAITIDSETGDYAITGSSTDGADATLIATVNGVTLSRSYSLSKAKRGTNGETGPQGPQGPQGAAGVNGVDGKDALASIPASFAPGRIGGQGDFIFTLDMNQGGVNIGEILIQGSRFIHPDGTIRAIANNSVVATPLEGGATTGIFGVLYLMWTDTSYRTRWPSMYWDASSLNENIVCLRYNNGWKVVDNSNIEFDITIQPTDCILAVFARYTGDTGISAITPFVSGAAGLDGAVGPQGPQGATGATGPQGEPGGQNFPPNWDLANDVTGFFTGAVARVTTASIGAGCPYTYCLRTGARGAYSIKNIPVMPGQKYKVTAWINASASNYDVRFGMSFKNSSGGWFGWTSSAYVTAGTTGWQLVSGTVIVPTGAIVGHAFIQINGSSGFGYGYITGMSIDRADAILDEAYAMEKPTTGLGLKLNYANWPTPDPGEVYIHGFNTAGVAADVNGWIYLDNTKLTVNKAMINPNLAFDGYIVLPIGGGTPLAAYYQLSGDVFRTINAGAIATISDSAYVVIGEMVNSGSELTESAILYPRAKRIAEIKGTIQQRFRGIADSVSNGSRTVAIRQTTKSGSAYLFTSATTRIARPGDCVFCRGGTTTTGASDNVKALRVFDGYEWAAPRSDAHSSYRELALLDLAAAARVYKSAGVAIPSDIDAVFDVLVTNILLTEKLTAYTAFIEALMTKTLKIGTGGAVYGGERYKADGTINDATKTGFWLGSNGLFKANGIEVSGLFTGTHVSIDGSLVKVSSHPLSSQHAGCREAILRSGNLEFIDPLTAGPSGIGKSTYAYLASHKTVRTGPSFGGRIRFLNASVWKTIIDVGSASDVYVPAFFKVYLYSYFTGTGQAYQYTGYALLEFDVYYLGTSGSPLLQYKYIGAKTTGTGGIDASLVFRISSNRYVQIKSGASNRTIFAQWELIMSPIPINYVEDMNMLGPEGKVGFVDAS